MKHLILALCLVPALVGCDHVAKHVAKTRLEPHGPVRLVAGVLDLRYTENRDVAFGALRVIPHGPRQVVIVAGNTLVLLLLGWLARRGGPAGSPIGRLGVAFAVAGGLGNLIDRLVRGYVVDFIHVHHWPVFNVADICIGVGAGLMLLAMWRQPAARET